MQYVEVLEVQERHNELTAWGKKLTQKEEQELDTILDAPFYDPLLGWLDGWLYTDGEQDATGVKVVLGEVTYWFEQTGAW